MRDKFSAAQNRPDELQGECRACHRDRNRERWRTQKVKMNKKHRDWKISHPEYAVFFEAKRRAKRKNISFKLVCGDITVPDFCPALGIPLKVNRGKFGATDNSPSLDRFDISKGYIQGNVFVISNLANRIKSTATSDQVEAVAKWMKEIEGLSQ